MDMKTRSKKTVKQRILVADDDKFIRRLFENILTIEGYHVEFADTGGETIRQLLIRKFYAVILDLHISGIEGLDLIASVRTLDEGLPIIVVTGDESMYMKRKVEKIGVFEYFIKPVKAERLIKVLKSISANTGSR